MAADNRTGCQTAGDHTRRRLPELTRGLIHCPRQDWQMRQTKRMPTRFTLLLHRGEFPHGRISCHRRKTAGRTTHSEPLGQCGGQPLHSEVSAPRPQPWHSCSRALRHLAWDALSLDVHARSYTGRTDQSWITWFAVHALLRIPVQETTQGLAQPAREPWQPVDLRHQAAALHPFRGHPMSQMQARNRKRPLLQRQRTQSSTASEGPNPQTGSDVVSRDILHG